MERKTITIQEFCKRYGYTWTDILRLDWLENLYSEDNSQYEPVLWNDCPAYAFFTHRNYGRLVEIYEDTAPVLAEILKRFKETQKITADKLIVNIGFHCFTDNADNVYLVTGSEDDVKFERFNLKDYRNER